MNAEVKVFRRDIRYPRIEIKNFETRIILPFDYSVPVKVILDRYKNVLIKKYKYLKEVKNLSKNIKLTENEKFEEVLTKYIKEFSKKLIVSPKKIILRKMRKRWGSCTKDGSIVFNKNLRFLSNNLIRYVVCHEICHLVERNHNENFYNLINRFYKNHKKYIKLLDSFLIAVSNNKS